MRRRPRRVARRSDSAGWSGPLGRLCTLERAAATHFPRPPSRPRLVRAETRAGRVTPPLRMSVPGRPAWDRLLARGEANVLRADELAPRLRRVLAPEAPALDAPQPRPPHAASR